ncbi:laminin subunit gamma-2 isoform X1 [Simochromis diagramma]|uniref:laminin subunit gamma-2 isoform X1 n=1 Tax=Simochromis diagramma TaxID=43689 RepID=UPI001A7EDE83|nr:laminin subunit gamma-2 isoform X1 [Simochromis diagramma]
MRNGWISLCGLLFAVCAVRATYRYYSIMRCECNGRSQYCLHDALGLHCVDCQGNTEGRNCERCKDGFYLQGAGQSCSPCRCNPTGSVSKSCDSTGRCSCKEGVTGDKCDRCPNGPIGADGCPQSRQPRQESESLTLPCFCYGHSSRCSARSGYSVHKITSTFTTGVEDWKVGTMQGETPADTHFRWSPKHQDVEVISKNSLPVYLYAPDSYLRNQLLSYGQNLSFSLRLDRGVRYPSVNDVILEGGGLRVAASLGDLRSVVPCGQKITYSFRLDERPGSKWRPQLSALQFQTLLQNLTAIKIRATFGDTGRGYLDSVQLVTAQRGDGVPARWVHICSCPPGHEGEFCQRCAPGFKRRDPADGAFSPCEPCSCRGGSCDPQTGDCYSADETPADQSCSQGFYRDPRRPETCVRCPCADGVSCSLGPGSLEPRCERCPSGTSGPRCDVCQEGYYGDPLGTGGVQRPCTPCHCNGHIDVRVLGSCDRNSGECLKCVNNTKGRHCEDCMRGFYHRQPTDACKPCNCDVQRSESDQCDASGQCRCRPGFEGLRCQRSSCPACFTPIKAKMAAYAAKLRDLESLFSDTDGGLKPANNKEIEAALTDAMEQVDDMMEDTKQLTKVEKRLQDRLSFISKQQLDEEEDLLNIKDAAANIKLQQQTYKTKVGEVQKLIEEMKVQLEKAKSDLEFADEPQSDSPLGSNDLSSLVTTATNLVNNHQTSADAAERNANKALSDSQQSLTLVRNLMNRENKVKELIGDLKTMYEQTSAQVKGFENQAKRLSSDAIEESKMADGMLKDIANMEQNLPPSLQGATDAMRSRVNGVTEAMDENLAGIDALQQDILRDKAVAEDLLANGKAAQQEYNGLVDRVNVAKADTEGAIKLINSKSDELEDALKTLKGFDQQIAGSKTKVDAAIKRLPDIKTTIQQAAGNNIATLSILGDVQDSYDNALENINKLGDVVTGLEGEFASLPAHDNILEEATKLNREATNLKTRAGGVVGDLASELEKAENLHADAQEASLGAGGAYNNARLVSEEVQKTLREVQGLLAKTNQSSAVDLKKVKQLEDSLAGAKKAVEGNLSPRLRNMEEQEAAHMRQLNSINRDIDTILADIANLREILASIPNGCYNSPPIEEA